MLKELELNLSYKIVSLSLSPSESEKFFSDRSFRMLRCSGEMILMHTLWLSDQRSYNFSSKMKMILPWNVQIILKEILRRFVRTKRCTVEYVNIFFNLILVLLLSRRLFIFHLRKNICLFGKMKNRNAFYFVFCYIIFLYLLFMFIIFFYT